MAKNTPNSQHSSAIRALALDNLVLPGDRGPKGEAPALLTGTAEVAIDEKGRITIPTAFRDHFDERTQMHVFVPPDGKGLWIFSKKEFDHLVYAAREQARRPLNSEEPLERFTLLLNRSRETSLDGHSRILISSKFLDEAGLKPKSTALIVGSGNFLEVLSGDSKR